MAFALAIKILPDDDTVPGPLTTLTPPPTRPEEVVSPALMETRPPVASSVVPTTILMEPAPLEIAAPVDSDTLPAAPRRVEPLPTYTAPELPAAVLPLLNSI